MNVIYWLGMTIIFTQLGDWWLPKMGFGFAIVMATIHLGRYNRSNPCE